MQLKEDEFTSGVLLAWNRQLSIASLLDLATRLESSQKATLAAVLYKTWLDRNETPHNHFVEFNLGVLLFNQDELTGAKNAYLRAISIAPTFAQPRFNLGLIYERLGDHEKAIQEWEWAENNIEESNHDLRPILISSLNNLGRILEDKKRFKEALEKLDKSLSINPDQKDVLHHWVFLREKQCIWPVYSPVEGVSEDLMKESTSALAMLSLTDDPQTQLTAAINYVSSKVLPCSVPLSQKEGYEHRKIRIGYCSSDFCLHPVAMLTAELFELHDRENFEVYGFCWTREDGSALRQRVIKAMDHFERINDLSDEAAARLIREKEIDILIDLHGQTLGARPNIFSYRPAPIQITYLGLPATTGLPSIDYVIADRFLIPEETAKFYSEKPIYMPDVYQVSDRKRVSAPAPSREVCGLPPDSFVFCSFNNNYKFTPEMFDTWMRILKRVPNSVLWLLSANPWAEQNLKTRANAFGIHEDRLIFAPRVAPEDYLARYLVADLFLDTFPFNAGTTANDALWMGLPLLTLTGRTFASRMAGALLTAAGIEELITHDFESYENKAVELALSKDIYENTRNRTKEARNSSPLFDMPKFVKNLEIEFITLKTNAHKKNKNKAKIHMNIYSQESKKHLEEGYIELDNLNNSRKDWYEYWPIRNFMIDNKLEEDCFYGFFSPRFYEKTGLRYENVRSFIDTASESVEIITFSPQPDIGAFFKNVFIGAEFMDHGFMKTCQVLFERIGIETNLETMINDSRTVVFSNYFVAKSTFWKKWFETCEKIFQIAEMEEENDVLVGMLRTKTNYREGTERKVFIIERIASLLLSQLDREKILNYDPFKLAWSLQLGDYKNEAIICDALKTASIDNRFEELEQIFNIIRNSTLLKALPPSAER